jgi:alpha-galactosidase
MTRIAIVGSGSMFTQYLVSDILQIAGLENGIFALIDVDPRRLELSAMLVRRLIEFSGKNWAVEASTNRREVLKGSRFVINQIEVAGLSTVRNEYEIPLRYGVKQCIGDTLGPGGLFKTLRTLPVWLEIVRDLEELCPNATILNYTNPMSAVTLATSRATTLPVIGLCHSIQHSSQQLAKYLDVPYEKLHWRCAGINHMSWFTELSVDGHNQYPALMARMNEPDYVAKDPVRLDFVKHFGAFVSESSGHFSEYIPYYRKRQDLIDKYCASGYNGATGFYANEWPTWRLETDQMIERIVSGEEEIKLETSDEYAAIIIDSIVNEKSNVIYGNVPNRGLIENLSFEGIVEVACLVDRNGIQPTRYGRLPEHLAALCRTNMSFFELAVEAVMEQDKEKALYALYLDPLSAAVCSPAEIKSMFEEIWEADAPYLPNWK